MWVYWADPSNRARFHLGDHGRQLIPGLTSRVASSALQGWLLRAVVNSACDQTSQKHIKMPLILSDCLPTKSGAIPRRTGESVQADSKRGRWRQRALVVRRVITCLSYRIHVSHIWRNLVLAAHAAFKDTLNSLRTNWHSYNKSCSMVFMISNKCSQCGMICENDSILLYFFLHSCQEYLIQVNPIILC